MNRTASIKRIARRYIVAGVLTPALEEILSNTFSKIPVENRALVCERCLNALKELGELTPTSVGQTIYRETQVPDTFVLIDVGHLFSDVGQAERDRLTALLKV